MKQLFFLSGVILLSFGSGCNSMCCSLGQTRSTAFEESSGWVSNLWSTLLRFFLPLDSTPALREIVEEATQNTSKVADVSGYPVSEHVVRTEDGYLLTMFHIRGNRRGQIGTGTVLVQHGIFGTSDMWVSNGNDSLAFVLANGGYDVWLGNFRGNVYCRRHESKAADDPTFWDFSVDELIGFDLPAMASYVMARSAGARLLFVGHSMGATAAFGLLAQHPEFNSWFQVIVALAPVVTFAYSPSFSRPLAENYLLTEYVLKDILGLHSGFSRSLLSLHVIFTWCPRNKSSFCSRALSRVGGVDKDLLNQTLIPKYFYMSTSGGSVNQLKQFAQTIKRRPGFFHLDRRKVWDIETSEQSKPKEYDLSLVTSPVAIYFGQNDALANPLDISWLLRQLPNVIVDRVVHHPLYNHLDFLWAKGNQQLLYSDIVRLLDQVSSVS